MTPAIRRYLSGYIVRRRAVSLICAITWVVALAVTWVILCSLLPHALRLPVLASGVAACIAIIARPIVSLLRRHDPVAAAVEIESRQSGFDQRLITVASQPPDSALLDHLLLEVEAELAHRKWRAPVSLRPMLPPALAMLAAGLALVWFCEAERARPSGPSLNRVLRIWNEPVNPSGK